MQSKDQVYVHKEYLCELVNFNKDLFCFIFARYKNHRTMLHNNTTLSEAHISDNMTSELIQPTPPHATELLLRILHMLAIELPKLNMSQDQYTSIHDGFIT